VGLARGYLRRPGQTAESFMPDIFSRVGGERLYRTGDVGRYLSNGEIDFIGRADRQVKVRGYRIELGEIEAQLARHPAIKEAVALAHEDSPGDKRLVTYYTVTTTDGSRSTVNAEILRVYLSALLPGHMMPTAYVELEALPLTPNGKLDRRALPKLAGNVGDDAFVAPRNEIEAAVGKIWCEALGFDRISATANFFHSGGHSLLATKVVVRVRQELGADIELGNLFAQPRLCDFASTVAEAIGRKQNDDMLRLLERIETMSGEDVNALLQSSQ